MEQRDGEKKKIKMKNVKLVPDLYVNLFSLSAALKEGCDLEGSADKLTIKKGKQEYFFDRKIKSGKGYIFGIRIMKTSVPERKKQEKKPQSCNIMKFHEMLGHASETLTRATAKKMGVRLEGDFRHCDGCALGKMRKKNVTKEKVPNASRNGDRLFLDISSIKYPSMGGARYLCLMMDDHSGFVVGSYLKKKSELQEKGIDMIRKFENNFNIKVKKIRCDNAGENQAMESECSRQKMGIVFEYTSVGTPQQNGRIERKFATLYGRVRAMFVAAGITGSLRKRLWAEAMNTAIDMNNIIVNQLDGKTPHEVVTGKDTFPRYAKQLRRFGEVGIILNKRGQLKSKMLDRGTLAIMVGYHRQSAEGVYRMLNLDTHKITQTRDVRWTQQMYFEHARTMKEEEFASSESESETEKNEPEETEKNKEQQGRLERALKKLDTFYNPVLMNMALDEDFCFVGGTDDDHDNPDTFREAWDHNIPEEKEKWREAIRKEFSDMIKRKVWRYEKKSNIPSDRRLIGNKWVFKKKRNGVYRARLVGLGYSQVPGIDHKDNFSPVVSEITFRIVMILALLNDWDMEIVDVVTAFLYGDLEETIFMKIPAGLEEYLQTSFDEDDCVILDKALYGLVQAARQFHKKLLDVMTNKLGFEKCKADECLLWRRGEKGTVIVCVYIDDTLCVGDREAIDEFKKELKEHFDTKEEGEMHEYVGCKVRREKRSELIMYQDDLIRKIEKFFGEELKSMREYDLPAGTGEKVTRVKEGLISQREQTRYRSGVGMLLFLVKYSRPDITNAARELSKVNDGATRNHMKMLMRVMKYVLMSKNKGLQYKVVPGDHGRRTLQGYCDSDWAGDRNERKSVTGYCVYFLGCLIAWKSRSQKNVTLSSSEAEYVAISEICCEIMFIKMILAFLNVEIEKPIKVFCDNVGAIYMSNNAKAGARTKHIDVRYHHVREYVVDGVVDIIFVRSEENDADIFTKNVGKKPFVKHTEKFMTRE